MAKPQAPVTPAIRQLREARTPFNGHPYEYLPGGGTAHFARLTGCDEHQVIKTLVMEDDQKQPMLVLMHGDREVSTRNLARLLAVRHIQPCDPAVAKRHTGYEVGGTSPFGTRKKLPIYCEAGIAELSDVYINGGKRGFIVSMRTEDLLRILKPRLLPMTQDAD